MGDFPTASSIVVHTRPGRLVALLSRLSLIIIVFSLVSCQPPQTFTSGGGLKVVATTSLVGDVVAQVGGDKISLEILLPLGTDPHSFSPTPREASIIADAAIVFSNGVGLEAFLKPLMDNIGDASKVYEVSQGIVYRSLVEEASGSKLPTDDPHTWMDPNNILIWVDNIVHELSQADPANKAYYQKNGQDYQQRLKDLDIWIRSEVAKIPDQNRKLVTDHLIFGYFADRYGFTQVGAIIPGFSSLAEPSARDIAQIEDAIHSMGARAVFINLGVNTNLAQRITQDTGTRLVQLYMESLSDKTGPAADYLAFMRYDVTAMVNALQ